jgi:hypothetical protein
VPPPPSALKSINCCTCRPGLRSIPSTVSSNNYLYYIAIVRPRCELGRPGLRPIPSTVSSDNYLYYIAIVRPRCELGFKVKFVPMREVLPVPQLNNIVSNQPWS